MHASTVIGGFSQGHADILRKAIGSKKMDLIEEWVGYMIYGSQEHGIEGGLARGFDEKMLMKLQEQWIEFGNYSFNKSHSDAYAYLSFVTAWLKNYYPTEFMAALLTSREGKRDDSKQLKNNEYMTEADRMKIRIKPPRLGISGTTWTPVTYNEPDSDGYKGELLQSLTAISGVSEKKYDALTLLKNKLSQARSMTEFMEIIEKTKKEGYYTFSEDHLSLREDDSLLIYERTIRDIKELGYFDDINPRREEVWEEYSSLHFETNPETGELLYSKKPLKNTRVQIDKSAIIGLIKSGALDYMNLDRVALMHEYYEIRKEDPSELPTRLTREVLIEWETESLGTPISVQTRMSTLEDKSISQWTGELSDIQSWVAKSSGKKHYNFTLTSRGEKVSCLLWGYLYGRHTAAFKEGNQITLRLEKSDDKMIVKSVVKYEEPEATTLEQASGSNF